MAGRKRVIQREQETISTKEKPVGMLHAKAFLISLVTLTIPALLAAALYYEFVTLGGREQIFTKFVWQSISIGGVDINLLLISLIIAFVLSAVLSLMALEFFFVHPIRSLRSWLRSAHMTNFEKIPPPPQSNDDIGGLGSDVRSAVAFFLDTKAQNKALSAQSSDFMTIASHQLRTPLNALLWSVQAFTAAKEGEREKIARTLGQAAQKMSLTIQNILAVAEIEEGKFGYSFTTADLLPITTELVQTFEPLAKEKNISLLYERPDSAKPVYMDPDRIRLALFNLLLNAIDYTPTGSVTLSVEARDASLVVLIKDTGIGISSKDLALASNKFYRGDDARKLKPDGSGVGLYLARNIIEKHASDLAFDTAEGKGTRASFELHFEKLRKD
jgi:signal transduction histidine kinase